MQLGSEVKVPTNWHKNLLNSSHVRRKVLYKSTTANIVYSLLFYFQIYNMFWPQWGKIGYQ